VNVPEPEPVPESLNTKNTKNTKKEKNNRIFRIASGRIVRIRNYFIL
jgi:hypothetical protein